MGKRTVKSKTPIDEQKIIEQQDRFYFLNEDDRKFRIKTLYLQKDENSNLFIIENLYHTIDILNEYYLSKTDNFSQDEKIFHLSILLFRYIEYKNRHLIERISNIRTRNINYKIETIEKNISHAFKYINKTLKNFKNNDMSEDINIPKIPEIRSIINDLIISKKDELGFPSKNPNEFTYQITTEAKALTKSNECLAYLKQRGTSKYISILDFENICKTLKEKYHDESDLVIKAIIKSKSRDHIAVFSITTESGRIYVRAVNEQKKYVKMEGRKFIQLFETPETSLLLYNFDDKKLNDHSGKFEFNAIEKGRVIGQFNRNEYCLKLACLMGESDREIHDQAFFYIDYAFTVCMYITIKRLYEDKRKFESLIEYAEQQPVNRDPFEKIIGPIL